LSTKIGRFLAYFLFLQDILHFLQKYKKFFSASPLQAQKMQKSAILSKSFVLRRKLFYKK